MKNSSRCFAACWREIRFQAAFLESKRSIFKDLLASRNSRKPWGSSEIEIENITLETLSLFIYFPLSVWLCELVQIAAIVAASLEAGEKLDSVLWIKLCEKRLTEATKLPFIRIISLL